MDPPSGVPRYTAELLDRLVMMDLALRPYAVAARGDTTPVEHRGLALRRWRVPARLMRKAWVRFDRPTIETLSGDVDVVHATNFVLPPLKRAAGVLTVHDLAFLREDVFPGGEALRDLVPWSVARAARILVPTATVGRELAERFDVAPEKISVTPEGVSPVFFGATPLADGALARLGIDGPFVLSVGTLEPRKNLQRLLEAWSRARARLEGWQLVLTGRQGWGGDLQVPPGVVLTGYLPDEMLPGLMSAAEAFCYPSLYEGFGLPPLEAMAAGTAVIAGRYNVAEEVLGDAAELVDPTDTDALAEVLLRVCSDPEARRAAALAGRARAASFTWETTARVTVEAYRDAVGR